ncbi:hypothetical protein JYU34_004347 [Plutella xylostella]|uniref:FLYWCH-type domain-containing protein n=1 Tax=Plutella xylostella TaxID=51655 RepID=A0ABQ7QXS5_PLUXY|nr:hypothetical protein JYU34_004347 [Plutella xylostella]
MFQNYTFNLNKKLSKSSLWYCTSRSFRGCRCTLKCDRENPLIVETVEGEHNHDPPQYFRSESGVWCKLRG